MEEYKDEYTSFESESKTQEIIGMVLGVCFFGAILIFNAYNLVTDAPVFSSVLSIVFVSVVTFFYSIKPTIEKH